MVNNKAQKKRQAKSGYLKKEKTVDGLVSGVGADVSQLVNTK